jgi:hypothetical protein
MTVRDPIPHLLRTRRPPYRRTAYVVAAYGFLGLSLALFLIRAGALWSFGTLVIGLGSGVGELLVQVRRFRDGAS